jgi:hypothetical protein
MSLPPFVTSGQPIKSADWNKLLREVQRQAAQIGLGLGKTSTTLQEPAVEIMVQNSSGTDRKRAEILGITGSLYTDSPVQDQPRALDGATPTSADHTGKFVILKDDIGDGCMGWAYISGTTMCQVNIVSATDTTADVKDSDCTQLVSGASGQAQILWSPGTTGTQWCLIRFPVGGSGGGSTIKLVQAQADGSNGSVSVKDVILKSDLTASPNFEITGSAYNVAYLKV